MKVVPALLLEKKRAADAKPPIPLIMCVKRKTKFAAIDLVKFGLKVHPDNEEITLKYTRTIHRLSANSTPAATLLWSRDLMPMFKNQRTAIASGYHLT